MMKWNLLGLPLLMAATMAHANEVKSSFLRQGARLLDNRLSLSRNLQTCSLGEEVVNCDTTRTCMDFKIQGCIVYCIDDYSCQGATIKNSSVFCQGSSSCTTATILDSKVECSDAYSCDGAKIQRSSVHCTSMNGCAYAGFTACSISCGSQDQPCDYAEYKDQCSCCDGNVCPSDTELQKCAVNGVSSEEFCSSESAGVTCAKLGNPICTGTLDHATSTTNDPASTTSTSEPQGTTPTSPVETAEPGGTNSASSPQYTDSTLSSQTTDTQTSKDDPPIVAIVVPVVVAAFGLAAAVVQRKKIVHVYNHYRVGDGTSNPPAKP